MRPRLLLLLWPAFLNACGTGSATPPRGGSLPVEEGDPTPNVVEHTLDNGLRLFILPRSGVPVASFVVQYRIGGVNEAPGNTGIAHLLEHLLFKGTTSIGTTDYNREVALMAQMDRLFDSVLVLRRGAPGDSGVAAGLMERIKALEEEASALVVSNEFDQILAENGARNLNAATSSESTTYFVELPSNRAELWFILEADRLNNPVFREFYTEKEVVAEERRLRLENSPGGLLYQAHLAAAFQRHPYGGPVIGRAEDLQSLSRRDLEEYFHRYYGPNNAVVAVAGDVDPGQIREWAEAYLGSIPRGVDPPPVGRAEPAQNGERRVEVVFDAEPTVRMGWKVPSSLHEDAPALHMLMSVLTGGRSSRLYRRLVLKDRTASVVISSIEPGQLYPGLFTVQATPLHPHGTEELEAAIDEELEALRRVPPGENELQRVRNQVEASGFRRLRSTFGIALQVAGSASLYGDWRRTFDFSRELRAVTPADIQRVVDRYFNADNRTVATLVKAPSGPERSP